MEPATMIQNLLSSFQGTLLDDPTRSDMIRLAVEQKECLVSPGGALATWTSTESTGRSPKDTVTVRRPESQVFLDWDSANNVPIEPETFDLLLHDALSVLASRPRLFVTRRVVGADPAWALPVMTVTDKALTALFTDNMFRPVPPGGVGPRFRDREFTLLALPLHKLDPDRYAGRLRVDPDTGQTSTMAVAMDYDRRIGIVFGSDYVGSVKKLMFTAMNYYLPREGILPLHCSANEGPDGDVALMLGLSGTGKTTLSADPIRTLIGDDEHGWSDSGIANFENGCYAKLLNLDPAKEPDIYNAVFHGEDWLQHGAIIENAMMYPSGRFDLHDERLTPNSRAAYPLSHLPRVKTPPVGGHPKVILFLAADANSVLPPIARLSRPQAMFWFLMGYTSKLAGTETGIVQPKTTFSRFFGGPFMPLLPSMYMEMFGKRMDRHDTDVYLVNTGWSAGPCGIGRRMDILFTRKLVDAAISGALRDVEYEEDSLFHLHVPRSCPGVPDPRLLNACASWADPTAYEARARMLAGEFADHFRKTFGNKGIDPVVAAQCPGL
jgi:phosphoenolpyruvate carboxykinase (ATP)